MLLFWCNFFQIVPLLEISKLTIFNAGCMLESLRSLEQHQCSDCFPDWTHWGEGPMDVGIIRKFWVTIMCSQSENQCANTWCVMSLTSGLRGAYINCAEFVPWKSDLLLSTFGTSIRCYATGTHREQVILLAGEGLLF